MNKNKATCSNCLEQFTVGVGLSNHLKVCKKRRLEADPKFNFEVDFDSFDGKIGNH